MSEAEEKAEQLVKELQKEYDTDIIMKGTEAKEREMIPFSSPEMNWLTRGGIAKGKMVEFYGGEGSGKTTSALDVLANYQELHPDEVAVFLDAENTLDKEWGRKIGVNWKKVVLIQPDEESGETLLNMLLDNIRTGEVGLVVVDSIPFLMSSAQFEGDLSDSSYSGNSALMTDFARKVVPNLNYHDCTCIMINQIRDKIGVAWTAYNTPGGHMLKHSYVQRFYFKGGKLLDEDYNEKNNSFEEPAGKVIQVRYKKNKVTKNDRRLASYTLMSDVGIDWYYDTIQRAIKDGIIIKAGSWYKVLDFETGEIIFQEQGEQKLLNWLEEDESRFKKIKEQVDNKAVEG